MKDVDIRIVEIGGRWVVIVSGVSRDELDQNPELRETINEQIKALVERTSKDYGIEIGDTHD